ncbi:hypothetical protein T09_15617 [Trichinella sp. T9]|nr:hypothetical protein T09_15617 [Trichinella sp. T9]
MSTRARENSKKLIICKERLNRLFEELDQLCVGPDMTVGSFLRALRRFIARSGRPQLLRSDNFQTFHLASRFLKPLWKFINERAPWCVGYWECLVRSIKVALSKVIGRCHAKPDELHTVLCEVEARINGRPLTTNPSQKPLLNNQPDHRGLAENQSGWMTMLFNGEGNTGLDVASPLLTRSGKTVKKSYPYIYQHDHPSSTPGSCIRHDIDEEELSTIRCDIEARTNARPLTYLSEDPKDPEVLTPYHFLPGTKFMDVPEVNPEDEEWVPKLQLLHSSEKSVVIIND